MRWGQAADLCGNRLPILCLQWVKRAVQAEASMGTEFANGTCLQPLAVAMTVEPLQKPSLQEMKSVAYDGHHQWGFLHNYPLCLAHGDRVRCQWSLW